MRPHIRKEFTSNPNKTVWVTDLKRAIREGNPKARDGADIRTTSIQNAVRQMRMEGFPLEIVEYGNAWKYMPNGVSPEVQKPAASEAEPQPAKPVSAPPAPKTLFEYLAVRRDGSLLLEDENGQLYSATPLHP